MTKSYKTWTGFNKALHYYNKKCTWVIKFEYDEYGWASRIWYEITWDKKE